MDTISTHYHQSAFSKLTKYESFINPEVSWRNKYKNGDPLQGPKFIGSRTFLVWVTDLWHLSKTSMLLCFSFAIVLYTPIFGIVDSLIYWTLFGFVFEGFWSIVWKSKLINNLFKKCNEI